ncbi:MAG: thymidine phosphorylase [Planctomycetota bacterium]
MRALPAALIAKKRDGRRLAETEIRDLVGGIVDGSLGDAQLAALLMAGYFQGADFEETAVWTAAMRDSGEVYDLSSIPGTKVDKHSTGGVGDKVSLVLAPLVASLGVPVPMVSGRGLGHTGGTIDKLESIPGFRTELGPEEFRETLERTGLAMSAATERIAPADRRMYAIRDVTATIESVPWITGSILSKKLAEGIDALVLDVKCGRGAFMKTLEEARSLAESLVRTAERLGCTCRARITNMDRPLGLAVGNALEVAESLACLRGERAPDDLLEIVLLLAADMLVLGGKAGDEAEGRALARAALEDGRALESFRRMLLAQGGSAELCEDPWSQLPRAPVVHAVPGTRAGYLQDLDPLAIGLGALELGAGRRAPGDAIDPAVGILLLKKPGERIDRGEPLLELHARSTADAERIAARLRAAVRVEEQVPALTMPLLDSLGSGI